MSSGVDRVLRDLEESIDLSIATTPITIVVMGPSTDGDRPGAKLRKHIVDQAQAHGAVVQPEHRGLTRAAKKRLGAGHNLSVYEMHLVEVSDVVVLIPDSAGSLCELGQFTVKADYCQKMVVFANPDHPHRGSFVADGPLRAARNAKAKVLRVAYEDTDRAWRIVKSVIEKARAAAALSKLAAGR